MPGFIYDVVQVKLKVELCVTYDSYYWLLSAWPACLLYLSHMRSEAIAAMV
jgi:hypothetical protein